MKKTNLKAVPKASSAFHALEAARELACSAHVLAASAIAWKRGAESFDGENGHPDDESSTVYFRELRQDSEYLAAQASLDALAHQAMHVLETLRRFRQEDREEDV